VGCALWLIVLSSIKQPIVPVVDSAALQQKSSVISIWVARSTCLSAMFDHGPKVTTSDSSCNSSTVRCRFHLRVPSSESGVSTCKPRQTCFAHHAQSSIFNPYPSHHVRNAICPHHRRYSASLPSMGIDLALSQQCFATILLAISSLLSKDLQW
jgi:hypothetical protein